MTTDEYMIVSNKRRLESALSVLREILPGPKKEYGITQAELSNITSGICHRLDELKVMIKVV